VFDYPSGRLQARLSDQCAPIAKRYILVPNGRCVWVTFWTGKVTRGSGITLACVTEFTGLPAYSLHAQEKQMNTPASSMSHTILSIPVGYMFCFCFFWFFIDPDSSQVISESAGPILTKFSGLVANGTASKSDHSFCDRSRGIAMATNFGAKFVILADHTFIWHTSVPNTIGWSEFRFQKLFGNDFSTVCRNLVRFGPVTQSLRC